MLVICLYTVGWVLIINKGNFKEFSAALEHRLAYPVYYARLLRYGFSSQPLVRPKKAYTIIIVGDSLTDYLRPYDAQFRDYLREYYPNKVFGIFNYGFGATNLLSIKDRLNKETHYNGAMYPAILSRQFDLILIESFGHNPLSSYPKPFGFVLQNKTLDETVASIRATHPKSRIVFMATIAPNAEKFGQGVVELSPEQRKKWAQERREYIENHIRYADEHKIPLINIYEKSLLNNDGNELYINKADYLHPSPEGVDLINKMIADYIYENRLLPL